MVEALSQEREDEILHLEIMMFMFHFFICNCEWVHKLRNGKHSAAIAGSDVNSRTLSFLHFSSWWGDRELWLYTITLELSTSEFSNPQSQPHKFLYHPCLPYFILFLFYQDLSKPTVGFIVSLRPVVWLKRRCKYYVRVLCCNWQHLCS